jgi:hypothetical protein
MRPAGFVLLAISLFFNFRSFSQILSEMEADEDKLLARTKQVNQFFRRFNGEEDVKGNRLYPGDKDFRSPGLRKNYLKILVDNQSKNISGDLYREFISVITDRQNQHYLDFHTNNWSAQVDVELNYGGQTRNGVLFMEIEKERLGYKWAIQSVYFHPFVEYFIGDTTYTKKFLHPMSHEVEFMNLRKIFEDSDSLQQYFIRGYKPDQMSLFLYEAGRGYLKFNKVLNVKFHFFQVPGWYFELTYVNRGGYNSGWMITNLVAYKPEEEAMLRSYIFYEK